MDSQFTLFGEEPAAGPVADTPSSSAPPSTSAAPGSSPRRPAAKALVSSAVLRGDRDKPSQAAAPVPAPGSAAAELPLGGHTNKRLERARAKGNEDDPLGPGLFDALEPEAAGGAGIPGRPVVILQSSIAVEPQPVDDSDARAEEILAKSDPAQRVHIAGAHRPLTALSDARNYVITAQDALGAGGAKTKARANIAAVQLLKQLQAAGETANREQQAELVKYVGWGGIPQLFDESNTDWETLRAQLKAVTTSAEYAAMRRSTLDAFFTSEIVVRAMWQGLERLGFSGGKVLEPSVGIGNFLGLMPQAIREKSLVVGVELDPITAGIAQQLYPSARIHAGMEFQEFALSENSFDAAVANPPYGRQLIFDAVNRRIAGLSIHNYFCVKSIAAVRPGGLFGVVVSSYLMDAAAVRARRCASEDAELVAAIRLPNIAFEANAGTTVTTDILFFIKRERPKVMETQVSSLSGDASGTSEADEERETDDANLRPGEDSWVGTTTVDDPAGGEPIRINRYFAENPHMILGRLERCTSGHIVGQPTVEPTGDLAEQLAAAIKRLPRDLYVEPATHSIAQAESPPPLEFDLAEAARAKVYGYFIDPSTRHILRRLPDINGELKAELILPRKSSYNVEYHRLSSMVELRDRLLRQIELEVSPADDELIEQARKNLQRCYKSFRACFGYLNKPENKGIMRLDPQWALLAAIETHYDRGISQAVASRLRVLAREPSAKDGMILTRRVRWPRTEPTHAANAKDALLISLAQRGTLDLDYMSRLTRRHVPALIAELDGEIFLDPHAGWQTRDEYLSGAVKKKLQQARALVEGGQPQFTRNVQALEPLIPTDIPASDIHVRAGAPWVPGEVMAAFARYLFGAKTRAKFNYLSVAGRWALEVRPADSVANEQKWGSSHRSGLDLLEDLINNSPIRVYTYDKDGKRVLLEKETQAAQDAAARIEKAFGDWIWQDASRRDHLVRLYNDRFNASSERAYDGAHLGWNPDGTAKTLPGQNPAIIFRPHQLNAIWRGIQERGGLLDHVVGAGKTFVIIAIVMELKRLGVARRPMIVVPNHLVGQWASDFQLLYPGAKVLVPAKEDFQRERRQQLLAVMAAADWDAVIVAHSSFGFIDMPMEEFQAFISGQVAEITACRILAEEAEGKESRSVKELERFKETLEDRLKSCLEARERDQVLDFSQLGIDFLTVDEAHEFKNLMFVTSLRNVAGLGSPGGSQKALDLFVKTRFIQRANGGANVLFATGTPISNSIAEMFTMLRYMRYELLVELGIAHFDAWQGTFATRTTDWEIDATATGYKLKERLARFTNLPELMTMYRGFADVVTRADIDAHRAAAGLKPLMPPVHGGKPENIVVDRSPDQALYMERIVQRAINLKPGGRDNMLVITNDARKAALDIRLVDRAAPDCPESKVNIAVEKVFERYTRWRAKRGAQLIFCDLSTPKGARAREAATLRLLQEQAAAGDETAIEKLSEYSVGEILSLSTDAFDVYNDIRAKLLARGVLAREIAFIHDFDTDQRRIELFENVRAGRVRILIGSTRKMGAGMNVQTRLVALHHLDVPWKPSEIEQREGRIIRQGNLFYEGDETTAPELDFHVEILRYATQQTYDARMWQTIEAKAKFIEQLRRGTSERAAEDIAAQAASAAEMKAAASGNPLIIEEVQARSEIRRLENLRRAHMALRHQLEDIIRRNARWREEGEARLATIRADIAHRAMPAEGEFAGMTVRSDLHAERKSAGVALIAEMLQMQRSRVQERMDVGQYRGFGVSLELDPVTQTPALVIQGASGCYVSAYHKDDKLDPVGATRRLDGLLDKLEGELESATERMLKRGQDLESARAEVDRPFDKEEAYQQLLVRHREIVAQLQAQQKNEKKAA